MQMKSKWITTLLPAACLLAGLSLIPVARATITLDFAFDSGTGNTTASYSGSWQTIGGASSYAPAGTEQIDADGLYQYSALTAVDDHYTVTSALPWSSISAPIDATSQSGTNFGFRTNYIAYQYGYTAGTNFSGSITFHNTLADLGLTSGTNGTITVSGTGNDINWSASTAAVPEPATDALLLGLAALGLVVLQRRRKLRQT